jgi:hypothetical protein
MGIRILETIVTTPWADDRQYHKADTYMGQMKHQQTQIGGKL